MVCESVPNPHRELPISARKLLPDRSYTTTVSVVPQTRFVVIYLFIFFFLFSLYPVTGKTEKSVFLVTHVFLLQGETNVLLFIFFLKSFFFYNFYLL